MDGKSFLSPFQWLILVFSTFLGMIFEHGIGIYTALFVLVVILYVADVINSEFGD